MLLIKNRFSSVRHPGVRIPKQNNFSAPRLSILFPAPRTEVPNEGGPPAPLTPFSGLARSLETNVLLTSTLGPNVRQPRRAASIAAMSILFICIIASNARLATARSGSVTALVRAIGVICQDRPHLSLHQPHALSSPPLPTIAFQ